MLQDEYVHIGRHEAAICVLGRADDGLAPDVEACIDDDGGACPFRDHRADARVRQGVDREGETHPIRLLVPELSARLTAPIYQAVCSDSERLDQSRWRRPTSARNPFVAPDQGDVDLSTDQESARGTVALGASKTRKHRAVLCRAERYVQCIR